MAPRGLNWPRPGPSPRVHAEYDPQDDWPRARAPPTLVICGSPSARRGGSRPIRVSVPWRGPRSQQTKARVSLANPSHERTTSAAQKLLGDDVEPDALELATVLAVIKVRPGGAGASSAVGVPADLDHVCARRPANPRSGRRNACGAVEQRNEPAKDNQNVLVFRLAINGVARRLKSRTSHHCRQTQRRESPLQKNGQDEAFSVNVLAIRSRRRLQQKVIHSEG